MIFVHKLSRCRTQYNDIIMLIIRELVPVMSIIPLLSLAFCGRRDKVAHPCCLPQLSIVNSSPVVDGVRFKQTSFHRRSRLGHACKKMSLAYGCRFYLSTSIRFLPYHLHRYSKTCAEQAFTINPAHLTAPCPLSRKRIEVNVFTV